MVDNIYIKYEDAVDKIQEGDVLLFRGISWASWIIKKASDGLYSHCGIASFVYDNKGQRIGLECIEFKEWKGSRAISLENYVQENSGIIDVFRPSPTHTLLEYDKAKDEVKRVKYFFVGRDITTNFRKLTGLPYGWSRIWWLAQLRLPFLRWLAHDESYIDILKEKHIYPVCSTVVAYLFHKYYTDLVYYRSDEYTEPSDLARSPLLNYLFTITK